MKKKLVLTIVLDCCNSGGVTRGDPCIRGLDWNDAVDSNYPLSDIMGEDLNSAGADHWDPYWTFDWLRNPRSFSLLTACGPHQRAFEIRLRDTNQTWHGCLSYFLVTSLQKFNEGGLQVSYQSLYGLLFTRFHAEKSNQSPMLLGNREVSFLGDLRPPTAECTGVFLTSDGDLRLNSGRAHGVCEDDEYELYPYAMADQPKLSKQFDCNGKSDRSGRAHIQDDPDADREQPGKCEDRVDG